ncbi:MAG TPA: GNAT family N-acetyltransferase [Armatimonadota bacterium]|nr:GNAT family N-acetyltransferase [Armatimonadota bacterium]
MTPGLVIKEGSRVRIRQLCEDDIPRMAAHGFGGEEGTRRCYAQELEKPDGPREGITKQFAVETKDGVWIGFAGFGATRGADAGGYFFIDEPCRGQGYGTELMRCVLQVMFEDCGAARCLIDYHDWNQVAARLYAKFGFEEKMRIRIPDDKLTDEDRAMAPGQPVHAVVIELTRERWEALQASR